MTARNLFNIVLKVLGIFLIKDILIIIAQLIAEISFFFKGSLEEQAFWSLIFSFLILAVYVSITYSLIFKTHVIIDKLKLDNGFDQDFFSFNLSRSSIIQIALIVTGATILINEIPNLFSHLYKYYEDKKLTYNAEKPDFKYVIYSVVKIIIALLLMGERKRISNFVGKEEHNADKRSERISE